MTAMNESAERLEPLTCPQCRIPKTLNPHPDAGRPDLDAGYLYECIPCLVRSRASWASRAFAAELRIRELESRAPAEAGAGNVTLRYLLCVAYAGAKFYGDDGELQDNREFPCIDFKRDSVAEIQRKINERGNKRLAEFLAAAPASPKQEKAKGETADADRFRSILTAVVDEMQREDGEYTGNAPGHGHEVPGIWDSDNGMRAGKPCAWCRTWKLAREAIAAAPLPKQED